jgi:PIN domain nuclease of toxin-antitoxin system
MIKTMKGNLDVGDARRWWADSVADMVLTPVMFRPEHVAAIQRLEPHHSDPFDRAIIATAIAEELVLLTTDKGLNAYAGHGLKILR